MQKKKGIQFGTQETVSSNTEFTSESSEEGILDSALRLVDLYPSQFAISILISFLALSACAPRVIQMTPNEGAPGTQVSLTMEYLVGWPRVEIGSRMMDYYQLKLSSANPTDNQAEDEEELSWIEDKILQFQVPDLPPGDYAVTIYDDKGPPGDKIYAVLETTAYVIAPPVWPFVFRSNQTTVSFRVTLPIDSQSSKVNSQPRSEKIIEAFPE